MPVFCKLIFSKMGHSMIMFYKFLLRVILLRFSKNCPLLSAYFNFGESFLFSTSPPTHHLSWLYPGYTHDIPTTFPRRSLPLTYTKRTISDEIVRYKSLIIIRFRIFNFQFSNFNSELSTVNCPQTSFRRTYRIWPLGRRRNSDGI